MICAGGGKDGKKENGAAEGGGGDGDDNAVMLAELVATKEGELLLAYKDIQQWVRRLEESETTNRGLRIKLSQANTRANQREREADELRKRVPVDGARLDRRVDKLEAMLGVMMDTVKATHDAVVRLETDALAASLQLDNNNNDGDGGGSKKNSQESVLVSCAQRASEEEDDAGEDGSGFSYIAVMIRQPDLAPSASGVAAIGVAADPVPGSIDLVPATPPPAERSEGVSATPSPVPPKKRDERKRKRKQAAARVELSEEQMEQAAARVELSEEQIEQAAAELREKMRQKEAEEAHFINFCAENDTTDDERWGSGRRGMFDRRRRAMQESVKRQRRNATSSQGGAGGTQKAEAGQKGEGGAGGL